MKQTNLIIGGAYFSDERLSFMDKVEKEPSLKRVDTDWQDVRDSNRVDLPEADSCFFFGLKTWTRKLRKSRLKPEQVVGKVSKFVSQNIDKDLPVGVLDDMNEADEADYGRALRKFFLNETNCKVFLLREYWTDNGENYDSRVKPFSICCDVNDQFIKPMEDKILDLYFRGDDSSPDRKNFLRQIQQMSLNKELLVYSGGEKSPEKLPREQFLHKLASAKFCLCFAGHGYCTFRYQEIPSVGSISVQPNYPWKVFGDYQDMISCVKYDSVYELKDKIDYLLSNPEKLSNIRDAAMTNFKVNHSTEARFKQFQGYLQEIV